MATTPSPGALRTPPTPLHGTQFDYEPYSPRRSKRNSSHTNPYSSFNSVSSRNDADPVRQLTPPTTAKRARFASTHLSSPPSSPAPRTARHRPSGNSAVKSQDLNVNGFTFSDSDQATFSNAPPLGRMLPTPSRTPKRVQHSVPASTIRVLNFQPHDPNDVMPTPRKMKSRALPTSANGFDLVDNAGKPRSEHIQVFTDFNARVPEFDPTENNPFIGPKEKAVRSQNKNERHVKSKLRDSEKKDQAAKRDDGLVYVFRGRKIFRKFKVDEDEEISSGSDLGHEPEQRMLKRQAGSTASRPLTRSAVKPRLLFPSDDQPLEQKGRIDEIDEEADTDIEDAIESGCEMNEPDQPELHNDDSPLRKSVVSRGDSLSQRDMYGKSAAGDAKLGAGSRSNPFNSWSQSKPGRKRPVGSPSATSGSSKRIRATPTNP